jgi:tRNA (guanine-N7-)-methyltransferase
LLPAFSDSRRPNTQTVENSERTAQFLAMMEDRRAELRQLHERIIPAGANITWEIGCGHGHFLTAYAHAHPNEICIGVDIVSERIGRAARKRDRAKLTNLHFIHAEARLFLETLPIQTSFSRLFVLFPDPWPKLRHHKHRIMQPDFLSAVAKRAGEGSRLHFRTDFTPYYDDTKAVFAAHPDWQELPPEIAPWPFEHETVFQSRAPSFHSLTAGLRLKPIALTSTGS